MASTSNILLSPLSLLYGAVTRARLALYRSGVMETRHVSAPVISVGNITTGGTGKTPLVDWLARRMASEGERVCILTRGYGRVDQSRQVLVSDGLTLHAEAPAGGDEPRLLAEALVGVAAVLSNANRVEAALWAKEHLNSTLFILDDGFQHLSIFRNLNLVTVDSINPWGGRRLLPAGRLREPIKGLERADAIVLSRSNACRDIESLRMEAERLSKGRPVFLSRVRTLRFRQLGDDSLNEANNSVLDLSAQPVAAFCALGNSEAFFAHVKSDGIIVAITRRFNDHHSYTQSDIDALHRNASENGAVSFVTTTKDAVKLRGMRFAIPCYVVEIELVIEDDAKLIEMAKDAIQKTRA